MSAKPLSPQAKALLAHLVSILPSSIPGHPETFTGYRKVHKAMDLEMVSIDWAESLKIQGLVELAYWLKEHPKRLPALTGIVCNQETFQPGSGYFEMHNLQGANPFDWWKKEIARAKDPKEVDWQAVLASV